MGSSLDKVLALAEQTPGPEDMAAELVLAALSGLAELETYLAADGSKNDDDGDSKGGDNDHSGHATFKKMRARGVDAKKAAAMCASSDKKVAACDLLDGIRVALSGLAGASGDWVEATAYDPRSVALGGDAKGDGSKPYGNVTYADPGYQSDGKRRYPLDTEEHVRAALSYIAQSDNSGKYSSSQLASIRAKIKGAARKHGIGTSDSSEKVAASYIELAARTAKEPTVAFGHGRFTGSHSHPHTETAVHDHDHEHFDDGEHYAGPMHRQGSTPARRY